MGKNYHISTMSAEEWIDWVRFVRAEAVKNEGLDENQQLAHSLMRAVAKKLVADESTMTARALGQLLNEVPRFINTGWQYSPESRGPCAAVKGAYWHYANAGDQAAADDIAVAFTTIRDTYAYEDAEEEG